MNTYPCIPVYRNMYKLYITLSSRTKTDRVLVACHPSLTTRHTTWGPLPPTPTPTLLSTLSPTHPLPPPHRFSRGVREDGWGWGGGGGLSRAQCLPNSAMASHIHHKWMNRLSHTLGKHSSTTGYSTATYPSLTTPTPTHTQDGSLFLLQSP